MSRMLVAVVVLLWSCTVEVGRADARGSGSMAVSKDQALVYATDADNGLLLAFDALTLEKVAEVKVGEQPFRVAVGCDDTVYVANRRGRSVSVITRGTWAVSAELPTGVEPTGLAFDGKCETLYVVSATARDTAKHGTLAAFDTATRELRWELPVGEEPRDVAVRPDGHVLVTLFKRGAVVDVNPATPEVVNTLELTDGRTHMRALGPIAVTGAGHVWAFGEADLVEPMDMREPTHGESPQSYPEFIAVPTASEISQDFAPRPVIPLMNGQGATAAVAMRDDSSNGDRLFVVNRESSTLSVVADAMGIHTAAKLEPGADGLVVLTARRAVFVYSQFTHQLQRFVPEPAGHFEFWRPDGTARGANEVLPAELTLGRQLFHAADDRAVSANGLACSTCHIDGRDDGHVWQLPQGPRQTPTLAGRQLARTAPYHWAGELSTLGAFYDHTVKTLMGGSGLSPSQQLAISAWVESLPAPQNPRSGAAPTPAEERGKLVFAKAQCGTCHAGAAFTNNLVADVGTRAARDTTAAFDVPSLLGLGRSAPFLHDGSAATLEQRFALQRGDAHGTVSTLQPAEVADLVAYLETL